MKKILFIAVGIVLSAIAGCAAIGDAADKARTIAEHVHTLKTVGCTAVPEPALRLLVLLIKSKVEHYPPNGICDPDWVRDVLIENLELLESANGVQNRSEAVGYSTDRRHGRLDQPDGVGVLLTAFGRDNNGTGWLHYRSGIDTQDSAFVHAPGVEVYSGSGGSSRLHLQDALLALYQEARRFSDTRGNGPCGLSCTNVET